MRWLVLLIATALGLSWAAVPSATAAGSPTFTWVGSSQDPSADNHSWTDPRNWSPNGVPSDGSSVIISEPDATHCTAHVDNVPAVALVGFSLASTRCSSSITGIGLTVTGTFTWNGGTLNLPTTIAAGATGTVSGSNSHLNGLTADLDVAGTLTLSGIADSGASNAGGFRIANPHVLHVHPGGTLVSSGTNAVQFLSCCTNPARIVNDGTLEVSAGDFTVRAVALDQNGTLTAVSGGRLVDVGAPLTAGAGAAYAGTGGWRIENGAKATLAGTQTIGAGFHLELGGLDVDAGAELGGTATLSGAGSFDWTGGTVEGNLTVAHGMTVHVSGAHTGNGKRFLSGSDGLAGGAAATLTNHGSMTVDQGAAVLTGYRATLLNAADGTLTLAPGTQFTTISCCVQPSRVVNRGRLTVPTGTSTAPVLLQGVAYQAAGGTTSIAGGRTLAVGLAPSSLSSTTVAGGGTLALAVHTALDNTITMGTATRLALQPGGSLDGTATIGGSGALGWTGGTLSGNLTIAASGGVAITGPDPKGIANVAGGSTPSKVTIRSRTAVAAGTSARHDRVDLGSSTLTLASSTAVGNFVDLSNGTLVNTGSLLVQPGRTGVVARGGSGPLINRGTLAVGSGAFRVDGAYTQTSGTTSIATGAHLDLASPSRRLALAGGALIGSGTLGAGVTNTAGTVRPGGWGTGTLRITGDYVQGPNGALAVDLAARARDLLLVAGTVSLRGRLAARDVGSYRPALGAKFRVLVGARVGYALSCVTTTGSGSRTGHWTAAHTSTGVYLIWRRGTAPRC